MAIPKLKIPKPPKAMPLIRVKGVTQPPAPLRDSRFSTEISQDTRRITGVTPKVIGAYLGTPARLIPRSKAFRGLAGATKIKGLGAMP